MAIIRGNVSGDIFSGTVTLEGSIDVGQLVVQPTEKVDYISGLIVGSNSDTLTIPVRKKCSNLVLTLNATGELNTIAPVYRAVQVIDINGLQTVIVKSTSTVFTYQDFGSNPFATTIRYKYNSIDISIEDNNQQVYRFASNTLYKYIAW